ncbi:hypothetical protein JVU11DRAFT_8270 [Chiua virens]|nr:hypothetical protein JVU11DRAFT_8270 [Chiua virens]
MTWGSGSSCNCVGIGNAVLGFEFTEVAVFLAKVHPTMVAGWTLSAFADSLIAVMLCYYLHKQRSGMARTDRVIKTLVVYTINTGALTSLFAILVIITFLTLKGTMDFTAFVQVQSKLYAISLFASLNARKSNANNMNGNLPPVCRCMKPLTSNPPQDGLSQSQAAIQIQREVDVEVHRQLSTTSSIPTMKLDV